VVINKVDKENCTPEEVHEKVFDLMFELDASEEQLDFPAIYGSAKNGWMSDDWKNQTDSITPLLDKIIDYFKPIEIEEGNTQLLITSLDYSSFVGRIAIGRLTRGVIKENMPIQLAKRDGTLEKHRIKEVYVFEGLERKKVESVQPGDICAITGIDNFEIGDTIADFENPEALKTIDIEEPTMSMLFTINNSPFFGKEGKFVTSRHLKERLDRELEKNLALRVKETSSADSFNVSGRGVLHLSVLIETMRREGYELQIGQPQVIFKEIDGQKCEPIEELTIDLPEEHAGKAIEMVSTRKGEMVITEHGIEGNLVYAASALLRDEIAHTGHGQLHLNLRPDFSAEHVLAQVRHPRGSRSLSSHLKSRLNLQAVHLALLHEVLSKDALNDVMKIVDKGGSSTTTTTTSTSFGF
jgi:GTP-binding protein